MQCKHKLVTDVHCCVVLIYISLILKPLLTTGKLYRGRRKWQSTPVFLPGKPHGLRILVGYIPWSRRVSDMTERLHFTYVINGLSRWLRGKESACQFRTHKSCGFNPCIKKMPWRRDGNALQYSGPMDQGVWGGRVHGATVRHDWATKHAVIP